MRPNYKTMGELEAVQEEKRKKSETEINDLEENLNLYRRNMSHLQDSIFEIASHLKILNQPDFSLAYNHVVDEVEHNSRGARNEIEQHKEELRKLKSRQNNEIEEFIARNRKKAE